MFRIVICDDKKENIALLNKSVRKAINDIREGRKTEIFSAKPDKLYNYSIVNDDVYIFILDTLYTSVSGIDIARKIRKQYKNTFIVFLTTHQDLINLAVNQNIMPSGFFEKSVGDEDIRKILLNIYAYCNEDARISSSTLTVSTGSAIYKIKYEDIIYIESLNKKIYIHTNTQRIGCYNSLQTLAEELGDDFVRCHKSYIVNKYKIKNVYTKDMYIDMIGDSKIPISRTYKSKLKDLLK